MSVLIAHPGTGVFVRQTVEALYGDGLLERFASTLVDDPSSAWQSAVNRIAHLFGQHGSAFARRPPPAVPRALIATRPWRECLRIAVNRIDRQGVATDRVWDAMTQDFDRWTATLIGPQTRAVYGYEYNALALFQRAAALGLPRILELPCAEHEYVAELESAALRSLGGVAAPYARHTQALRAARTERRRQEFALATRVIVNSPHTLHSYQQAGLNTAHFRVIPLGCVLPELQATATFQPSASLRVIWAGTFSLMKGAHLLLQALRSLEPSVRVQIDVYGSQQLPAELLVNPDPRLHLHGPVPQAQLFAAFAQADVLLLPSLSDGWGMVVSEAMAHGLPVIATTAVGAAALIEDGVNGRVIAPGDVSAVLEALRWALAERALLQRMRAPARAAVEHWPWSAYRAALAQTVRAHLDGE